MARPRIFISSTYFDLKSIREELDRFISTLGYESVRHELGHISYGREASPESYAYREVEFTDILVSIIGSRYGTAASDSEYSISQVELKKAHTLGKQVYIFIDEAVHSEFKFYQSNKNVAGVHYGAVTDPKIYSFIEEIYAFSYGNPIFSFKTGGDLVELLKTQWAGLFQRLLNQESSRTHTALTEQLQQSLQTVDQLVKFLKDSHADSNATLQEIIFSNHPIFTKLRELTKNKYRIYFTNLSELKDWLENAKTYKFIDDKESQNDISYMWMKETLYKTRKSIYSTIEISRSLFDEELRLKPLGQSDWNDAWMTMTTSVAKPDRFPVDDDIPF